MNVVVPQMGETSMEGTVAAWHVQPGDQVEANDLLLDIETDKAAMEISAPIAGTIAEILIPAGEAVTAGTVLAVIQPDTAPVIAENQIPDTQGQTPLQETGEPAPGTGPEEAASQHAAPLSPAVRRLLAEHGLDPSMVTGTGQGGRIKRSDVLEYLQDRPDEPEREPAAAGSSEEGQDQVPDLLPFPPAHEDTMQRPVNARLLQAIEVDFTGVARIRDKHRDSWREKTGFSLTYLPFIARAVCLALGEFPHINASMEKGGLRLHPQVNLAIAVDLRGDGPMAPVIRNAETFSVARFAERIHSLAVKARSGTLDDDDLKGGTFTISNSGTFGTLITSPIINHPQVAALSMDVISKRPVVASGPAGDSIAIRYIGILTQCFDNRAVDGAYAAAFLRRVKVIIEESDWLGKII